MMMNKSFKITKMQEELIKTLAKGMTLKDTAEFLGLKYFNLQKRTELLYKKFGVNNRASLIQKALDLGFIKTIDIKSKFRKRFLYKNISELQLPVPAKSLTEQEISYLKLLACGYTQKEIMVELNILNIHFCNYIQIEICKKLGASNICNAVWIASALDIIHK